MIDPIFVETIIYQLNSFCLCYHEMSKYSLTFTTFYSYSNNLTKQKLLLKINNAKQKLTFDFVMPQIYLIIWKGYFILDKESNFFV